MFCADPRGAVHAGFDQAGRDGSSVWGPLVGDLGAHRLIADRVAAINGRKTTYLQISANSS